MGRKKKDDSTDNKPKVSTITDSKGVDHKTEPENNPVQDEKDTVKTVEDGNIDEDERDSEIDAKEDINVDVLTETEEDTDKSVEDGNITEDAEQENCDIYVCLSTIKHHGKEHKKGDVISGLAEKDIPVFIKNKIIEIKGGN